MKKYLTPIALGIIILFILVLSVLKHKPEPVQTAPLENLALEGEIKPGDSLYSVLTDKFSIKDTFSIGKTLASVYDPRLVKPGDKYEVYCSTGGEITRCIYSPSPLISYIVSKSSEGFIATKYIPELDKKILAVRGTIKSSLYEGMRNAGVDAGGIMNFAAIFQWQVDFLTEVRPGDEFFMVFTEYYLRDKPVKKGHILLAGYKGKLNKFTALRFQDKETADFYDFNGDSFNRQFLKAPLSYTRISSSFNLHRKHPILKYVRPHYGIDYAAPVGTPVSAVASGVVLKMAYSHDGGRYLKLRHKNGYTTFYAHLYRYAKGMKVGRKVQQGRVIAYSGSSGLSTGPHLYFRISKHNKPFNFLTLKIPAAKSVSKRNKKGFAKEVEKAGFYLKYLESDFFNGSVASVEDYKETQEYKTFLHEYINNKMSRNKTDINNVKDHS